MTNNYSNISDLEDFLWNLFTSKLIKTKYLTELPSTNKASNAVVIDIPSTIRDMNGYADGSIVVTIYAKPLKSGFRNPIIGKIENEIYRLVEENTSDKYTLGIYGAYNDYDAARDLHARVILLNITIG